MLFPAHRPHPAITKRDLVRYYASVAPVMLPYLAGRPVNLHRYPDGIAKKGFWHKAAPEHAPEWIERWRNDDADPGETEFYLVFDTPAALAWAANYGAIEIHPWTSTVRDSARPTWAMIDIDPGPEASFDDVLTLARLHRVALDHLGVQAAPKITGKRGIQIWVPVADRYSFDETREWVESVSRTIGSAVPELVSWEWKIADRHGLTRLDYTQNAVNKTLVAPFSARPAPAHRCRYRSGGTNSTTPSSVPTAGRSPTWANGSHETAIRSHRCSDCSRCCRRSASPASTTCGV